MRSTRGSAERAAAGRATAGRAAAAALALCSATALAGVAATAPAAPAASASAAEPASLTLNYQCTFPLIGPQRVAVKIDADIPKTVTVNVPVPKFTVDSVSTVSAESTRGLVALYSKTVEGTAVADATLTTPDYPKGFGAVVTSTLEKTPLPASGPFDVKARGTSPNLKFRKAGPGRINVGNLLLTLTPRLEDGGPSGLGTFESECVQEPGQDNLLAEFEIVPDDTTPPPVPGGLRVAARTADSVTLAWDAVSDEPGGSGVAGYRVRSNGAKTWTVADRTELVLTGLERGKEYAFTVSAFDRAGNESKPSDPPLPVVVGPPPPVAYGLSGSSFVKAANGSVPLGGRMGLDLESDGGFQGDLELDRTTGTFQVLGFLPAGADLSFTQHERATGTLSAAGLAGTARVDVRLPSVRIFGIEIGGGGTCATASPTVLALAATGFTREAGGTVTGVYTLPALQGCGPLTPFISAVTEGPGNTVTLTAAPGTAGQAGGS
ncbi:MULTISPECIES: fibronectin type III domain-containing protein [Actinomadura]|uniref:DUF6801 domain-containing protein n=1 Tax=Actinomadura yumaensis TaxID=111807 RepID=A0ABW2CIP8_9ACTN|nr:fibronectin type III domain-containing protein [Actinomadura sp. J1-007]MWK34784.1 fibronectin type III domain-containing protein [Actinomadura sp. J1-007]